MNTIMTLLPWIQIGLAILLIITILFQSAEESLGGAFGGSDDREGGSHVRRGAERTLFKITVIIAVLFVASVILGVINPTF